MSNKQKLADDKPLGLLDEEVLSPITSTTNNNKDNNIEPNEAKIDDSSARQQSLKGVVKVKFPSYPSHGIIGPETPPWLNALRMPSLLLEDSDANQQQHRDFRKQRFDFHQMYERGLDKSGNSNGKPRLPPPPTALPGVWSLWQRLNSISPDFYENQITSSKDLPSRFKHPELQHGYGCENEEHPFFKTTSSIYGQFPPTVHDVPRQYHALKTSFSSHLASTGMPKNRSLNIK